MKLILASNSPRRRELMTAAGFDFTVRAASVDERAIERRFFEHHGEKTPEALAMTLAEAKGRAAAPAPDEIIVAADTVVALGPEFLGKPKDPDDAKRMLRLLSGKVHRVATGVCLLRHDARQSFFASAEVRFFPLDEFQDAWIERYVASGSPMDKAGAYGIQDAGSLLIESVSGDYYSVVGLPIAVLARELHRFAPELFV